MMRGVEFDEGRERWKEVDGFDVGQFSRGEEGNLHGAVRAEQCGEGGFGHVAVAEAEELIDTAVREEEKPHWSPTSEVASSRPCLVMWSEVATGRVSKYWMVRSCTRASSKLSVILNTSPSSLCAR